LTPTDRAVQTFLEQRRDTLIASQSDVIHAAIMARAYFDSLARQRLCPKEVARLEALTVAAEQRSDHLMLAITALNAELADYYGA
jgi:hypothetical protein